MAMCRAQRTQERTQERILVSTDERHAVRGTIDELAQPHERPRGRSRFADPIRVLLADDHPALRAGTRRILEDEPDLTVVGEAADGPEAIILAEQLQPDLVLLDISMPNGDGIAAFPDLRRVAPSARLLVLTAHDKPAYLRACYRLGANGYLLKSAAPEELVAAIRRVYAGERVYAAEIAEQMRPAEQRAANLTGRELEIIRLAASGLTNRELAEAAHVSESTIEFHLRNIYTKLGATYRTEAVMIAQRQGWLDSLEPLC